MASRKKKLQELARLGTSTRRDYTREEPLTIKGTVARVSTRPNRWGFLAPVLGPMADMVPSIRPTAKGRSAEKQVRGGVMVFGLAVAVWGGSMATALLGCVIAMLAQAIPVNQTTKLRWQRQIAALKRDREITVVEPVEVVYDGRGVSVMESGTTWRRVLTPADGYSAKLRKLGDQIALGVLPPTGGKSAALWFRATPPADAPKKLTEGDLTPIDARKIDRVVTVDYDGLAALHDLLA